LSLSELICHTQSGMRFDFTLSDIGRIILVL
jgi:hypothetical protein